MPDAPVPYDPSLEVIEPDEAETIEAIDATMAKIRARTLVDEGRPLRSTTGWRPGRANRPCA